MEKCYNIQPKLMTELRVTTLSLQFGLHSSQFKHCLDIVEIKILAF